MSTTICQRGQHDTVDFRQFSCAFFLHREFSLGKNPFVLRGMGFRKVSNVRTRSAFTNLYTRITTIQIHYVAKCMFYLL